MDDDIRERVDKDIKEGRESIWLFIRKDKDKDDIVYLSENLINNISNFGTVCPRLCLFYSYMCCSCSLDKNRCRYLNQYNKNQSIFYKKIFTTLCVFLTDDHNQKMVGDREFRIIATIKEKDGKLTLSDFEGFTVRDVFFHYNILQNEQSFLSNRNKFFDQQRELFIKTFKESHPEMVDELLTKTKDGCEKTEDDYNG